MDYGNKKITPHTLKSVRVFIILKLDTIKRKKKREREREFFITQGQRFKHKSSVLQSVPNDKYSNRERE